MDYPIDTDEYGRPIQYLYFLQAGQGGPIKIGLSSKLKGRVHDLQSASPEELKLLCAIPHSVVGDEAWAHEKFKPLLIRGEWYEPHAKLLEFIKQPRFEQTASERHKLSSRETRVARYKKGDPGPGVVAGVPRYDVRCKVCSSINKDEIEKMLADGVRLRAMSRIVNLSRDSLSNHRRKHMGLLIGG